ncbi:MAG TPA: ribosome maturation factor RimP [Streptosporangiaceae bacterium]|nr:ribosome maturation factor RimP [Streptosporangiaceae bacterium]
MAGGSRHAPGHRPARPVSVEEGRIADAIRPVVSASGMDLESVRVSAAGRRRLLRVVVDSDNGVSLDDAAVVSRELSGVLDSAGVMGDFPYTLEVSSPGVDRPLTETRHWRRASGRLVKVALTSGDVLVGRVVLADDEAVILDVEDVHSRFPYAVLGAGAVQLEFGRLPERQEPEHQEPDRQEQPEELETRDGH